MFDFLKKLFGKKQEPSEEKPNKGSSASSADELRMPSAGPSVYAPLKQEMPKPVAKVVEKPKQQMPVQSNQPVAQPVRPVVQPTQSARPAVQPTRTVVKPPVKSTVKYESRPAWTAGQKPAAAKPAVAPVQTKPRPQVVAPRSQPGRVAPSAGKRVQKTSVYIGLDFGTTFTKAAYEIAPSNVHIKYSVRFGQCDKNEDYYLPSVLYFDPNTQKLKIFDSEEDCEEIRYFKYNMISDALKKNEVLNDPSVVTQSVKEELCSVFFLSYVINLIRNAVYQNFSNTKDAENTVWYINMGVPLEAHRDDKRALVYKHVLEVAYLLEQKYHGKTEIDIHELDAFYVEHRNESNPNINILPEIYAEVLLYQQYLNTTAGFYTVVDIGGGTEDIATFLKMSGRYGEQVDCLAQNVIGYGYDSLSEKIAKTVTPGAMRRARALLKKSIDFNDDESLREVVPQEVDFTRLIESRKECRTLFGTCVQKARKKRDDVLQQTVAARLPMHVFVMGGARSVEFYRASIEYMKKAQGNAGIPFFKDSDVFDYVGRNTRLEIRNDQRLVISQMLAQPFEMIPEITNMPWNLKDKDVTSRGKHWTDLAELQNELYPE